MKQFLFIFLFFIPVITSAQPKFWISNKVEIGYDNLFITEQVTFEKGTFSKNSTGLGLKFKISKTIGYKTFYLLQKSKKFKWANDHFLGVTLNLKLQ